jgi:UDP-N-acetyl-D-glucosamine dehydrogenase
MKIAIIGQGYVGLSLSVGAASVGHQVFGFDTSGKLVDQLLKGETFVPGIQESKLLDLINSKNYLPTNNSELLDGSDIIIIAVPTPLNQDRKPDLSYLASACLQIAKHITTSSLIVNESTSYPGTLRNFIKMHIESKSQVKFLYASAPERIDPGNSTWDLYNTPRIVSGLTALATQKTYDFYSTFCSKVQVVSSPEVAEGSKLFENTFRQINIALANEFAIVAHQLGFSATEAINAASTKPFGFMPFFPGIGVGGHCIPVDPSYLSYAAELVGSEAKFIELANSTNLSMAKYTVDRITHLFGGSLLGKSVQIAGIAYKPDIPDLRESPALLLITELKSRGALVTWCDPHVQEFQGEKSSDLNPKVDIGLIVTPHKKIDFSKWQSMGERVLDLSALPNTYGWSKFF